MRIMNIMFGRGQGGLEQAALDYHEALILQKHDVLSITHPHASINETLASLGGRRQSVAQGGEWDIFAAFKLRQLARKESIDVAIAHGNRAIGLALKALSGRVPVVGVAHNYHLRRFPRCDAVFAVTRDLMEEMVHLNIPRPKLFHIPNMVRTPDFKPRPAFRNPPVIGTLGRFVEKKGFDIFLQSIKSLQEQQIEVKAIIGGDGPLEMRLRQQAARDGIAERVQFPGWIKDKNQFFEDIDIFVLPSHHEPFGIVLIEAMACGLPCITTDTEGPCEIIRHEQDAVMIEKARPYQMAQAIAELLLNPERAHQMGESARFKARERYNIDMISIQLNLAVERVLQLAKREAAAI
jgi:glycosyltransferase involved in cell wall biosynthesis